MKLISLNEWCSLDEARKGPAEPVPQELQELCISPDSATRELAAYQLPNYDRTDTFFIQWGTFLSEMLDKDIKTIGAKILKWSGGGRVNIKKFLQMHLTFWSSTIIQLKLTTSIIPHFAKK